MRLLARETLRSFFALLGKEGCQAIRVVVMDMNGAYEEEVRAQCPQAEIVYDLFHVVAKYGREVIARVRGQEAHRLRSGDSTRQLIKSSHWLLLRNRDTAAR